MTVLSLANCPQGLRGDLTKWLVEVSAGVYVGQLSARIRARLWERVVGTIGNGRAVMVFNTNNEQRLDFMVHGDVWEPIDFDGVKLMLRPSPSRLKARERGFEKRGFSDAAKMRIAKRAAKPSAAKARYPNSYTVIDLETTGLNPKTDEIIEFGALWMNGGVVAGEYQALVKIEKVLPSEIVSLTGINDEMLAEKGVPLDEALRGFVAFIGDSALVAHNMEFDKGFIENACAKAGVKFPVNREIDTLSLSRRLVKGLASYKLSKLAEHFGFDVYDGEEGAKGHRGVSDCKTTVLLYEKLMEMM